MVCSSALCMPVIFFFGFVFRAFFLFLFFFLMFALYDEMTTWRGYILNGLQERQVASVWCDGWWDARFHNGVPGRAQAV